MSFRRDGFAEGAYWSGRPLEATRSRLSWTRLRGQANHDWVVLTLRDRGWVPSAVGLFVGPTCAVDTP
jgi:hypothetical protein